MNYELIYKRHGQFAMQNDGGRGDGKAWIRSVVVDHGTVEILEDITEEQLKKKLLRSWLELLDNNNTPIWKIILPIRCKSEVQ